MKNKRMPKSVFDFKVGIRILATTLCLMNLYTQAYSIEESFLSGKTSARPSIMLWVWERPEDLSFINPHEVGIAFLAKTIYIKGDRVYIWPRLQPLGLPQGAYLTAVVHMETDNKDRAQFSTNIRSIVASSITELTEIEGISAIQIDFDAKVSERIFYRDLIYDLRGRIPRSITLSITALASWCLYDYWLSDLSVEEVVPMLFRMGPDRNAISLHFEKGEDFKPLCRKCVGISTDETLPKLFDRRRLYIFNPKVWSKDALNNIIKEVKH